MKRNSVSEASASGAFGGGGNSSTPGLKIGLPEKDKDLKPRILVIGIGGGGCNAVNNMVASGLEGVEFIAANTDAQALESCRADYCIQLGPELTKGLGAGSKPDVGRAAAEEVSDEIGKHLENGHMAFITAGMGGGTGTGAAPVFARIARDLGLLSVAIVTKPFDFEGRHRLYMARQGLNELHPFVDTLVVVPNQNLFRVAGEETGVKEAFAMADQVLYNGISSVSSLMINPGIVNLDFADVRSVMEHMGKARIGTGEAEGESRAVRAVEEAIANPLLSDGSMEGARAVLVNVTGGETKLIEVQEIVNRVRKECGGSAHLVFGAGEDERLSGKVRVSLIAAGLEDSDIEERRFEEEDEEQAAIAEEGEEVSARNGGEVGNGGSPLFSIFKGIGDKFKRLAANYGPADTNPEPDPSANRDEPPQATADRPFVTAQAVSGSAEETPKQGGESEDAGPQAHLKAEPETRADTEREEREKLPSSEGPLQLSVPEDLSEDPQPAPDGEEEPTTERPKRAAEPPVNPTALKDSEKEPEGGLSKSGLPKGRLHGGNGNISPTAADNLEIPAFLRRGAN